MGEDAFLRLFPGLGTAASALENQACAVSGRSEGLHYGEGLRYPVKGQRGESLPGGADGQEVAEEGLSLAAPLLAPGTW